MKDLFQNEGAAGAEYAALRVRLCTLPCPRPHVHFERFEPAGALDSPARVVLTANDAELAAAWLESPADALRLESSAAAEQATARFSVFPDLSGARFVAFEFNPSLAPGAPSGPYGSVILSLESARELAATVRALLKADERPRRASYEQGKQDAQTRGALRGVSIPENYALRLTLQGDELRWHAHALAALAEQIARVMHGNVQTTGDLIVLEELERFIGAGSTYMDKARAVFDVFDEVVKERAAAEQDDDEDHHTPGLDT